MLLNLQSLKVKILLNVTEKIFKLYISLIFKLNLIKLRIMKYHFKINKRRKYLDSLVYQFFFFLE
jgi:hypothetical protein